MKGTICALNSGPGMIAIETETGDFSVFENLSGEDFEIGDEVWWRNATGLGDEPLTNLTQRRSTTVYFQNHWISRSQLRQHLLG